MPAATWWPIPRSSPMATRPSPPMCTRWGFHSCFQSTILDPGVDFGLSHVKSPRQRFDRKAVTTNFLDLQVMPTQFASNGIRAAAKDAGGLLDRMRGQLLA